MAQQALLSVWVLVTAGLVGRVGTTDFRRPGEGLTEIPWDEITADILIVKLQENDISGVGQVPTHLSLTELTLRVNKLTTFPDVRNLSSTLQILLLGKNPILEIRADYLRDLTEMVFLGLDFTPIVALPDAVDFPPKLDVLGLGGVRIPTLPNMCLVNNSQRMFGKFHLKLDTAFVCDSRMLWTKLAFDAGVLSRFINGRVFNFPRCEGRRLADVPWEQITIRDLTDTSSPAPISTRQFRRFRGSLGEFPCRPAVLREVRPQSKVSCGRACLDLGTCALFATDGGRCVLTEFTEGVFGGEGQFSAYEQWYILY